MPSSFFENVSRRSRTARKAGGSCVFSTAVANTRPPRTTVSAKLFSVPASSGTPVYSGSSAERSCAERIRSSSSRAFVESAADFRTCRFSFGTSSISTDSVPAASSFNA